MNKFEVGDKVRIIKLDINRELAITPTMKINLGECGVVVPRDRSAITTVNEAVFVETEEGDQYFYMPDWLELVEKAKKPWNGKVICISSVTTHFSYFTKGKIYKVKNGVLFDDTQTPFSSSLYYDCPTTTQPIPVARFIEFKGFANK